MEQPPALPSSAPAKKGIPAIAWVGMGCGGLVIIAMVIGVVGFFMAKKKFDEFAANPEKAAAQLIVATNPELEKISENEKDGQMTIRTKDGKEVTLSYKDISEGRIVVTDEDGNETSIGSNDLSKVPAWVPMAPDFTDGVSMFQSVSGGKVSGQFSVKTTSGVEELKAFYERKASDLGLTSSRNSSMNMNGTAVMTQGFSGGGKSITVIITQKPGVATQVNTNYEGEL